MTFLHIVSLGVMRQNKCSHRSTSNFILLQCDSQRSENSNRWGKEKIYEANAVILAKREEGQIC